ncbi:AAA family ATPase [Shewanella algae]|uniref:AAA family ATPase n=1 Tax=Shewanella algae TaxID=38313 RepID=UPI003C3BD5A1
MKIKELELENFKVFKSQVFKFKKITVLAGANSAGKSTVLNALASILQGSESRPFPFYFSNYGENVHLGGFKDIVTGGLSNSKFSVGITFNNGKVDSYAKGVYRYATNGQQILIDDVCIKNNFNKFSVKWEGQNKGYSAFREISIKNKEKENKIASLIMSSFSDFLSNVTDEKADDEKLNKYLHDMTSSSDAWEKVDAKSSKDLYSSINEIARYKISIDAYKRAFLNLLNNTSYIGPIRPYPSRHYFLSSYQDKMDALGANAFQLLIGWYKSEPKKFNKIINDLRTLKLAESLSPDSIKDELVELNVQPFGQKHSVNLSDVGFGLSQILPVLVANAAAEKDGTLLVNQPEVHLHPSSQAMLADYFCNESKGRNFIIETHSEYLINRLRLLVAKGKLSQDDVSIIYIDNGCDGPEVSNISIEKSGALTNAPESFFDTYYVDSNELVFACLGGE